MKTILIVDDSATSRMLFNVHLPEGHGFTVHEADSATSALQLAIDVHPDLVLTDYTMPDMNGVELVEKMRDQGVDALFILLTANVQQSVLDAAKAAGINQVLEKPLNSEKMSLLLAKLG